MALIVDRIVNGETLGYHRISHVTIDSASLSGHVKVESFADQSARYTVAESRHFNLYPIQWLRDANYIADAYTALAQHPDFLGAISDSIAEHVDSGGTLVMPARPSMHHFIDYVTKTWVADLGAIKTAAKSRLTVARDAAERAGFLAYGKTFDADSVSLQRISIAVQAAQAIGESFTINWTCADNSTITLDYAQMLALPAIMAQAANTLHIKARSLKSQIDAATTLEEIEAVVW